jgi:hypothetical protein
MLHLIFIFYPSNIGKIVKKLISIETDKQFFLFKNTENKYSLSINLINFGLWFSYID